MAAKEVIHFQLQAQLSTRLWYGSPFPGVGCGIPAIKPNLPPNPQVDMLCLRQPALVRRSPAGVAVGRRRGGRYCTEVVLQRLEASTFYLARL
jgi:hypothetical protein